MKPEFTELSFGFAVVFEMANQLGLKIAPGFPSQNVEGKEGGGYDVELNDQVVPLYLQFKRSDCFLNRGGREFYDHLQYVNGFGLPYYRFALTTKANAGGYIQHSIIHKLAEEKQNDYGVESVFYVAPAFHTRRKLNDYWNGPSRNAPSVAEKTYCFFPLDIGPLDEEKHTISFTSKQSSSAWLCSKPEKVEKRDMKTVLSEITGKVTGLHLGRSASPDFVDSEVERLGTVVNEVRGRIEKSFAEVKEKRRTLRRSGGGGPEREKLVSTIARQERFLKAARKEVEQASEYLDQLIEDDGSAEAGESEQARLTHKLGQWGAFASSHLDSTLLFAKAEKNGKQG